MNILSILEQQLQEYKTIWLRDLHTEPLDWDGISECETTYPKCSRV